jgi:hypothetical protein
VRALTPGGRRFARFWTLRLGIAASHQLEDPSMADEESKIPEPRGFGEHARGLSAEYAHEQGWGINEEERTQEPSEAQDTDGGTNYEYGARDFGDEPLNTERFEETAATGSSKEEPATGQDFEGTPRPPSDLT